MISVAVTVVTLPWVDASTASVPRPSALAVRGHRQPVLELGRTGTVRFLADLDGYLTPRSDRSPRQVTLAYVRAHRTLLGLTSADLKTFRLHRRYRDVAGIDHLFFTQRVHGRVLARHGLTAAVTSSGHLLTLGGTPVSGAGQARLLRTSPHAVSSRAQALARAGAPVTAEPGPQDTARRVLFESNGVLRPAWETVTLSVPTPATTIVDAVTGRVLQRIPLTHDEHSRRHDSTARAFPFFPGARRGGRQVTVDLTRLGWLGRRATILSGNNAHAFSDVDGNGRASRAEEVHPRHGQAWDYRLSPFHPRSAQEFCGQPYPCSWNPNRPYSWRRNRAQATTQAFYLVNRFHDHLARRPIGFGEDAGNFQRFDHVGRGVEGDPVEVRIDTGADTGRGRLRGLPDEEHVDDAYMVTPPDGTSPTMHLFLNHRPFHGYPRADPWSPTNTADAADTVFHEYTHGLSGRLVVDVRGRGTLDPVQGDSMGEAWSDWYALDYLVDRHLQRDRPGLADVRMGRYEGAGMLEDRTEPIDCRVGQATTSCTGGDSGHGGGYTYADFGHVVGEPEVHADGEIWGQTLWDLRDRLGSRRSEMLVTRAMELAPYDPSFLDMRDAILVADTAVYHGGDHTAIWQVFAIRGMGWDADTDGAADTHPTAGFAVPPGMGTGD
ncbi:MAG: M36 family metallopeptidase [Nocardioides sp.]